MKYLIALALLTVVMTGCGDYEAYALDVDLERIATIESSGNTEAYNPLSKAVGAFQFTAIAIRDFNQVNGAKIKLNDMYNESKAAHVAIWYLEERIPSLIKSLGEKDTIDNRLIAYNCGISCVGKSWKDLPQETLNYIKKYHELSK